MLNIKIIFVDTNKITLEELLSSCFLSEEDIVSLQKYKFEETKKEKACSLILKNKYVGEYHLNEFGKPISDKCYFSISHSHGAVVFVKCDLPIGVDIEKNRPVKEDMIDYISSIEEKEYIKSDVNFYEIWTNKEAVCKCLGTGIKDKIKDIPSLPINSIREFKGKLFYNKTVKYLDYIISVSIQSEMAFELDIKEERL